MKKFIITLIFLMNSFLPAQQFNYMGTWDKQGVPDYLEPQSDTLSKDFVRDIRKILIPRHNLIPRHPELFKDSSTNKIFLKEDADVYLAFFDETAGFRNVFGYYSYNVNDISNDEAINFNGENQYGLIPNYSALNTQNLTMEFWVWPDDYRYSVLRRYKVFQVYIDYDRVYVQIGSSKIHGKKRVKERCWSHIVVTVQEDNGKTIVKIYLNGKLDTEKTVNTTLPLTEDSDVSVSNSGSYWYLKGGLDEVTLYNVILSQDQITERYNNGNGTAKLPTGINEATDVIARFQFNNVNGERAVNNCALGQGHNMTLYNSPATMHGVVGRPPMSPEDLTGKLTVIYPNVSRYHRGGGLFPGNKVKIGHFPAGTVIGWFLYSNGFREGEIKHGYYIFYSDDDFNPNKFPYRRQGIMFKDRKSGKIIVGFEDLLRPWGDKDFDDATFYVTANPSSAIDDSNIRKYGEAPPDPEADLSLALSVSNSKPDFGEEIELTLTVKNGGPASATGIQIYDKLPKGLAYVSHSAEIGTYDVSSGIWSIDSLPNGASKQLKIKAKVSLDEIAKSAFDIGPASGYNVFIIDDMYQPTADTEGKLAVGDEAYFENYTVGHSLRNNENNGAVLVSGYNLTYNNGIIYGGDVTYVHETNLPDEHVDIPDGEIKQDTLIDFQKAEDYLLSLSNTLKEYTANGKTEMTYSQLALTGTNPFLNVFNVKGEDLSKATEVVISVPNGAVVLVNIGGDNINWSGGLVVSGTDITNVMYNFYEATNIKIKEIDVTGSILAPKAHVNFVTGVQNGQMIAKSLEGSAQFNNVPFIGLIPADSIIVDIAEITAVNEKDPDSKPGNGVESEDDYASTTLSFIAENATNNTGVKWEFFGNSGNGQLIWTMIKDKDGKILSGNWGGDIYRLNNDNTWTLLNPGMEVNYIWSLAIDGSTIYAGTDKGIFISKDNGGSWKFSFGENLEIRSLCIFKGKVYAATWGGGVFVSENNGTSWTSLNDNLKGIPFTSIVFNSAGDIFLSSFDSGILKSTDAGETFSSVDIDYRYIWTLAVNSSDYLFAGTYGNGIYSSIDNGNSWEKDFSVPARYIYNFNIDAENNLFASSWSSGVFVAKEGVKLKKGTSYNWHFLGLTGMGVSSIIQGDSLNELFAATENGKIYVTGNALLGIENLSQLPMKFQLQQNYPNPFGEKVSAGSFTTIKFSLSKKENVTLSVFDILGRKVKTLVNKNLAPGEHKVFLSAEDLPSGVYFYELKTNSNVQVKKMVILK